MTAEEEKTIRLLETRTRQLILKFSQLKEENEELLNELVKKDTELQEVKKQNQLLEANYSNLKMAKMLAIGDTDLAAAKLRISRLVRDVDKCIALLKAMGPEA
jgi:predicted nuclease with TOPRIM domain